MYFNIDCYACMGVNMCSYQLCIFVVYLIAQYPDDGRTENSCLLGNWRGSGENLYRSITFVPDKETLRITNSNRHQFVDVNEWTKTANPCIPEKWHCLCIEYGKAGSVWVNGIKCKTFDGSQESVFGENKFMWLGANIGPNGDISDAGLSREWFSGHIACLEIYERHIPDSVKRTFMQRLCDTYGISS